MESTDPLTAAEMELEIRALYRDHGAALFRYAVVILRGPDAVQEVFLRYFLERSAGRTVENPRAWLFRSLRDCLPAAIEPHEEAAPIDIEHVADERQDVQAVLEDSEAGRRLGDLLSAREREGLALRGQGLSYAEIADVMGLAVGTVGALLTRAYRKIRDHLAQESRQPSRRKPDAAVLVPIRMRNG